MQSMLVIGMGVFGKTLASKLVDFKNEVMIVDENEEVIEELSSKFTDAQIGDCTKPDVLEALGVENFDKCFVTVGENFQSSLEITSLLKDLGAKYVVSKAKSSIQEKFLLRNGADEVIFPENEIAKRLAIRSSRNNLFDFFDLSEDVSVYEVPVLNEWVGRSISDLEIRNRYHVNVLAIKIKDTVLPLPGANYIFKETDHVLLLGKRSEVNKFTK